ncbi:hypothetical protein M407DRAFT_23264 [Tulasnella calospora MUT 4182]|uniref:Uncharacterized protein n=1 Tax=Tulasnella calospora MUT 4182 TaxID=1051891 RepID=A0A0C3QLF5_9AGAM|nr:hypothetical protein M407DRAFT_23264 [Tulasnella calospora MUT 4182]
MRARVRAVTSLARWSTLTSGSIVRVAQGQSPLVFANDVGKGRFYLKDDILKLLRHFQRLKDQPSWTVTALRAELIAKRRERNARPQGATGRGLTRDGARKSTHSVQLCPEIQVLQLLPQHLCLMATRWGWSPVAYEELPRRLKQIANSDYLIDLPDLNNDAWDRVCGDLKRAIRKRMIDDAHSR